MDVFLDRVLSEKVYTDIEVQAFVVCFLEEDPRFFRSGYIKEELLKRIKRSTLKEALKNRLRNVLLDAVNRRAGREFKKYCSLASAITNEKLLSELVIVSSSNDSDRARRANMMLRYASKKKENC